MVRLVKLKPAKGLYEVTTELRLLNGHLFWSEIIQVTPWMERNGVTDSYRLKTPPVPSVALARDAVSRLNGIRGPGKLPTLSCETVIENFVREPPYQRDHHQPTAVHC